MRVIVRIIDKSRNRSSLTATDLDIIDLLIAPVG